jgi:DNA topoisomerase-1
MAAWALEEFERFDSQAKCKRNIRQAIESVARRLGNTAAVCRKSYVHPEVLNAYVDGSLLATLRERVDADLRRDLPGLRPEEAAVLAFLRTRLAKQAPATPAAEDVASTMPAGPSDAAIAFECSQVHGTCVGAPPPRERK